MSHTPGPWKAVKHGKLLFIAPENVAPFAPKNIAGMVGKEDDANLIASAPELLDALQKAHDELERYGHRRIPREERIALLGRLLPAGKAELKP